MSGPWEKFATPDAPPAADAGPWAKFAQPQQPQAPSWGQVIGGAVKNLPKGIKENLIDPAVDLMSPARLGARLATGQPSPTADTAKGLATLATHPVTSLGKIRDHYVQRYGSMEGFKKALMDDPVGIGMDASMLLDVANAATGRQLGNVAKMASDVTGVTKVARGAGNVGAHALGHLTGAGPDAVKQAVKAGYTRETEFIDSLNGKFPAEDTVKLAAKSIGGMRKERNANYQALMKTLGQDGEQMDFNKVLQAWQDSQKFQHFEGTALSELTEGLDKKLLNVLDDWYQKGQANPKYFSPEGMDALKKRVRSIKENIPFERRADRSYVGDLEKAIKEQITEHQPIYSKVMKDYAQATEGLEEIERALSLNDKATYDTGIRKLLSAMRNNANSNYGNRLKMVDKLEEYGAKGLKSRLAGMQMSSALPRGLAGRNPALTGLAALFDPRALALLPMESPALVGRGLYGAGAIPRVTAPIARGAAAGATPAWALQLLRQVNERTQDQRP